MIIAEARRLLYACSVAVILHNVRLRGNSSFASARSLLQTVLPTGGNACNSVVNASCTLLWDPAPPSTNCSLQNAQQMAQAVVASDPTQGVTLAFYGDSITKLWKDETPASFGTSDVYKRYFGNYSAAFFGLAGDQSANLLWRLHNGEVFTVHPPQVSVLLIGTTDLGVAACAGILDDNATVPGLVSRIQNITYFLRQQNPYTTIVLLGLLPRGDQEQNGWYPQPNKFTASIANVNAQLSTFVMGQNTSQLVYVDCTAALLYPDGQIYNTTFVDGLHPTDEGLDRLGSCLAPVIYQHCPL